MGMTITEKILSRAAGKKALEPGELINASIDFALANDITAPLAIQEFENSRAEGVFDRDRIALIPDHFTPNKDILSAQQCKILREFAQRHKITHYYEVGRAGIEHAFLPEQGLVVSGDCIIGADSHTCTYGALGAFATGVGSTDFAAVLITGKCWFKVPASMKFIYYGNLPRWVGGKDLILFTIGDIGVEGASYKTMEFTGEVISKLSMDGRFTICNMVVEAGAKNGIIPPDSITEAYLRERARRPYKFYNSDSDAKYDEIREYDCSKLELQVAFPHLPSNVKPISQVGKIPIDQVVIGSCTNGRLEDLRMAAEVLRGHRVAPGVRLIVIPATPAIYFQALKEGLLEIFLQGEGLVSPPTCGPCLGGHMGILAEGEKAVATTNRNFLGRMGHPRSEVYLAGPAVAAASAILGRLAGPEEI